MATTIARRNITNCEVRKALIISARIEHRQKLRRSPQVPK